MDGVRPGFFGRLALWLALIGLLPGGCHTGRPAPLVYQADAQTLVVSASLRSMPGGGMPFLPFCNQLPELAIWGDGWTTSRRQAGKLSAGQVQAVLKLLQERDFLVAPAMEVNLAGAGLDLAVNLASGRYAGSWNLAGPDGLSIPLYQEVLALVQPELKLYRPLQGRLLADRYSPGWSGLQPPADAPEWPGEKLGVSLAEVPPEGWPVSGEAADYAWEALADRPLVTWFREGQAAYAVSLEIPRVLEPRRPGRCW